MIESAIAAALKSLGLPAPRRMFPVRAGSVRTFEVELYGSQPVWVRIPTTTAGLPALRVEEAALTTLRRSEVREQIAEPYSIVGVGELSLAVLPRPRGTPASARIGSEATALSRATGAWLSRLPDDLPTHATAAAGGELVREQSSWALAVEDELSWARERLAREGWGLGSLEEALARQITEGLATIDGVRTFAPVHRDLSPDRVFHEGDEVTAVVDWERTWIADPTMQWAGLVLQPAPVLGPMLEAFGAARVREGSDRLAVYAALEILSRYASRVEAASDGNARAAAAELAVSEARVLEAGVPQLLDAALPAGGVWPGWSPRPSAMLLRRILHRLATDGDRLDARLEQVLAGALLSLREDNPAAEAWHKLTWQALDSLPATGLPRRGSRGAPLVRGSRVPGPFASGATTAWLVQTALDHVGPVDEAVLAATARRVERHCCLDERPRLAKPAETLHHLVLGVAAAVGTDAETLWSSRLVEEWGTLEPNHRARSLEAALVDPRADLEIAPLLLALSSIPGRLLPVERSALLAAIAFEGAPG